MAHLSNDFLKFFMDLAANNNRDWFNENKKRYENSVKKPFVSFVDALIEELKKVEPSIQSTAKTSIFRIYRDIRFSKDKTPYKLHASAFISSTSKKDFANPRGLYLEINPEAIRVYGGVYQPNKDQLLNIRRAIVSEPEKFQKLIANRKFKKEFGTIQGDKNKRIPKEFKEAHATQELIANKQFYYFSEIDSDFIDSDDLIKKIIAIYKTSLPMSQFLNDAINS